MQRLTKRPEGIISALAILIKAILIFISNGRRANLTKDEGLGIGIIMMSAIMAVFVMVFLIVMVIVVVTMGRRNGL